MANDSSLRGYGGAPTSYRKVVETIHTSNGPEPISSALREGGEEVRNPTEQVRSILNLNGGSGEGSPHSVFTELEELCTEEGHSEWKETARWLKFVEVAEPGGQKWSKPHVSTLTMHSLFQLRDLLFTAVILLDENSNNMSQIADVLVDEMISKEMLEPSLKAMVYTALMRKHIHHLKLSSAGENAVSLTPAPKQPPKLLLNMAMVPDLWKFMRKIPQGSEICNVLVGEMESLAEPIVGFVRLAEGVVLQEVTDMPLPVRFLFVLFGPIGSKRTYLDVGRAFATLMSDEVFREVAYKATSYEDLLAGLDEFMDKTTVLPPSQWDPTIRVDPPSSIPSQADRLKIQAVCKPSRQVSVSNHGGVAGGQSTTKVQFYKTPFAGIVSDFKARHRQYYWSDIKDGFNVQMIASIVFIFFGNMAPAINFGSFLFSSTEQHLGPTETILAIGISNFIFALLAAQPQVLLGPSGSSILFDGLVYSFCKQNGLPFFSFRFWISFWTMILSSLIAIFNLSAIVRIFTRFTVEMYLCMVAFIFTYDSFTKLLALEPAGLDSVQWLTCWDTGVNTSLFLPHLSECTGGVAWTTTKNMANCSNGSIQALSYVSPNKVLEPFSNCSIGTLERSSLSVVSSGAFVMSIVLYFGTFLTALNLREFRNSHLCTNFIRRNLSRFAILTSVIVWVAIDQIVGYPTKKLDVPDILAGESLYAEKSGRTIADFVINPLGNGLPTWAVFAAFVPAIVLTIMFFMINHITTLAVNRKENKMKKPSGYHLDFLLVSIIGFIHGILGLPFMTGAIVRSITQVQSLQMYAPFAAPGEKPKYLGVMEQRISSISLGILASLSILARPVFQILPIPVLYAVFLFIAANAIVGVQLIERLLLFITPHKYWPDYKYLRNIRNWRMYLYTALQLGLLCFLFLFKIIKELNIMFPSMILLLAIARYFVGCIFTPREMELMDDLIPSRLYPKCARKTISGEDVVDQGALTPESFTDREKEKGLKRRNQSDKTIPAVELDTRNKAPELTKYGADDDLKQPKFLCSAV